MSFINFIKRAQNQVITEKAAALHHTMPQHFTRSMESDCQQTTKKIGKYALYKYHHLI